jgi:hypothetical protein
MRATGTYFDVVDLYNSATGAWSTAQLSVARSRLAATSVGNVALFAGGISGGALLYRGGCDDFPVCVCNVGACCCIVVVFFLRPLALSHAHHSN